MSRTHPGLFARLCRRLVLAPAGDGRPIDPATAGHRALKLRACEFIEGDFNCWRPQGEFDVIVFSERLGYAHDPGDTVASFLRPVAPGGAIMVSDYRSGHWAALWRRLEYHVRSLATTTVASDSRQVWDIKLMQARAQS